MAGAEEPLNPRDLSIGDAIAAEAAADRLARLQRLVIGLVRYGVAARGMGFLDLAGAPTRQLIERTIARLTADGFAGPIQDLDVEDALIEAAALLRRPPSWRLIGLRACPACSAESGSRCRVDRFAAGEHEPHMERIVEACRELRQPPPRIPRREAQRIPCPKCRAAGGEPCRGKNGPRTANHQERVNRAQEHLARQHRLVLPAAVPEAHSPADPLLRIGARTKQPVLSWPYETAATTCFKCRQETLVYTWSGWYEWTTEEPPAPRPATVKEGYSKQVRRAYWANLCGNCGVIQGDYFLYSEPDGPFFGRAAEGGQA
jgi:hypothetical protein